MRSMLRVGPALLGWAALLACAAPAGAEIKRHPKAGVQIEVPDGWKAQTPNENTLTMTDPREEVGFVFVVVDATDVQKALKGLDAELARFVTNVTWEEKGKQVTVNGMEAITLSGEGFVSAREALVNVLVLATPTKRVVLAVALAEKSKFDAHVREIRFIQRSLRPTS